MPGREAHPGRAKRGQMWLSLEEAHGAAIPVPVRKLIERLLYFGHAGSLEVEEDQLLREHNRTRQLVTATPPVSEQRPRLSSFGGGPKR